MTKSHGKSPVIDWQQGLLRFPVAEDLRNERAWSVVVCGDWAPRHEQQRAIIDDPVAFYGGLLPIIQSADLSIVNVECVLSDDALTPIVKDGIHIRVPTTTLPGLSSAPFHLGCLANNHIYDFGVEGLIQTKELLERRQIRTVGAGRSAEEAEQAAMFHFGEVRVAIVNVAEGEEARATNGGPGAGSLDLNRLRTQIAALRLECNVVIVVVHAGRELLPVPTPHIRALYRALAHAGADLIVGHHPHVRQGIEVFQGVPIVYSLGNFAFRNGGSFEAHHLGYLVNARFCGARLRTLEIVPYQIGHRSLSLLEGERRANFLSELAELSAVIADDVRLGALWDAYVDDWFVAYGIQEIADSAVSISNKRLLVRALLKPSLRRFKGRRFGEWLVRKYRSTRSRASGARTNRGERDGSVRESRLRTSQPSFRRDGKVSNRAVSQLQRGAAILRNRFDTMTHRELYLAALSRVMEGKIGQAPEWARTFLVEHRALP